ncbi:MAG: hypothetical protein KA603_15755 [Azonexus sp.]|nr:hypothetical protein [Betaproteobacteria bacterium]MBK8918312.1 hypothetical protein [Betaproteobacteria bacterium]MBP6037579.1 hypothetical protein [Azonexus sp.]
MSGFENYDEATRAIELEIERKGVILGIDWTDDVQVRLLAREALLHAAEEAREMAMSEHPDPLQRAKVDLFGLAAIMLRTLQESAQEGFLSHGGPAWKAFGRALWAEATALGKR